MMDKYYKKLSSFLIHNHDINKDDGELYEYAAKVAFQGVINIVVTILIGIAFGMLLQCLCFISVFFVLRKFTGGLHAEKYLYCLISSIAILIVALLTIRILERNSFQIVFLCLTVISVILIFILSPIENKNKPLSLNEKKVYKIISINFSLSLLIITHILIVKSVVISYSIGMGIIVDSLLAVLVYFKGVKSFGDR